ncbi:hypothetical protein [Lacticaseibacillus daqingensis]|uniref:hypothetical protein n=1 Tax=Lacticaseibacillus daqingensis TaxID=2486014 RepID=UPI000F7A9371|nr:hypothetical protein [Lacticaseibacillus daqingensis]
MKKRFLLLLLPLLLTGCHALAPADSQSAAPTSQSKVVKVTKPAPVKKKVKPNTTANVDDLTGHYFVNTQDHNEVLQFTADTSGYIFDIQRRVTGGNFTSAAEGLFNAKLTTAGDQYTITGTAQPNAKASTLTFQKLSSTKLRQLPDGPTYTRVKNDDRSTIK